jgi:hypothetical protein
VFPFRLSSGMYVCASNDGAVLLDLKRDAYLGFDAQQSAALSTVVADWPRSDANQQVAPEEALGFARTLQGRGILAAHAMSEPVREAKISPAVSVPPASVELMPWHEMRWHHLRPGHFIRFVLALISAWLLLRFFGLPRAVERARVRRAARGMSETLVGSQAIKSLISSWFHVRCFFYSPKGRCLLDSLVLLEFLAHYGVNPAWVIGVQIRPFAAHSWLQSSSAVLNGTPEYVRSYQPLLVV